MKPTGPSVQEIDRTCKIAFMYRSLARAGAAMMLLFVAIGVASPQTADDRAVQHARRVLDLLGASKFDEVAKEFNDRTAARMDVSQLRTVWTNVRQQAGEFKSI